jgi:hypothetical protein
MSRRSWFSKIFTNSDPVYFIGIQLIIKAFGEDTLRRRLATVIADPDGQMQDVESKRRYIKRIVALLLEQDPYWTQAFWDYKTDPGESEEEFNSWATELAASTATVEEEMGDDVDGMRRLSMRKDYVAATIIMNLSVPFQPAEAVPDDVIAFRKETLRNLVNGLMYIDPETILADGIFVVPGNSEDGLSEEDLLAGGWEYLRILT